MGGCNELILFIYLYICSSEYEDASDDEDVAASQACGHKNSVDTEEGTDRGAEAASATGIPGAGHGQTQVERDDPT